jgi:hypothetical protein
MYENEVLRKIFGHKKEEAAGGWRKLHNVEFYRWHTSPKINKLIK